MIDDIYDVQDNNLRVVPFAMGSPLKDIATEFNLDGSPVDQGTLDAILKQYKVISEDSSSKIQELDDRITALETLLEEETVSEEEIEDDN